MQIKSELKELLQQLGSSKMASVAYDTAWIARTIELGEEMGEQALDWLRENQLANGCWGSNDILYNHDRAVSTLSAMIALARWGDVQDKKRIERARLGLDISIKCLHADIAGATVGFEMLAPLLLDTALEAGAINRKSDAHLPTTYPLQQYYDVDGRRQADETVDTLRESKKRKLASLPDGVINRFTTVTFSAEMMGKNDINLFDLDNLQEKNGSLGCSPSATAYFALDVRPGDPAALAYLRNIATQNTSCQAGGFPVVAPYDLFEIAWALWNLALLNDLDDDLRLLCEPHLDHLNHAWQEKKGLGFSVEYTPTDGDDTGLTYDVLSHYGRSVDIEAVLHYQKNNHFHCYPTEADPSISANIHVLGSLRQAGYKADHPTVQNIVAFLTEKRLLNTFWFDKWHVSPYYATSHAIISGAGYISDSLLDNAIDWILASQLPNGAWGYHGSATAEETAYCIQALLIWKRHGGKPPIKSIKQGLKWLSEHNIKNYRFTISSK